jgi:acyl-homoserine-lactone acylase
MVFDMVCHVLLRPADRRARRRRVVVRVMKLARRVAPERAVRSRRIGRVMAGAILILSAPAVSAQSSAPPALASQVEVRRTTHGVPHIKAANLAAAEYGLAYVQCEDYGARVPLDLLRARGEMGRWFGRDSMARDFVARLAYQRAVETYPRLDQDTRDVYEGFAAGVNRYVELHPEEFPPGFAPHFTGYDVLAHDVSIASAEQAMKFLVRMDSSFRRRRPRVAAEGSEGEAMPGGEGVDTPDEGSNAWAFAPSRTKSKHAILLRNPHLQWSAGYYEAHLEVPGTLDFYGDFRIGGPFGVVGGFNRDLGWATTNNAPLLEQIYALDVDSTQVDHYLLDGASLPLERELVRAEFKNGPGLSSETREVLRTSLGPVIYQANGKIYVLRASGDEDFRGGEQFLRMMRAHSLAEWKDAMRMRARVTSNFTYADRAGNIFYVWNGSVPSLPVPSGGDTAAVPVRRTADVWTHYVPFDSLPQFLNPKGGYVQNSNDPPYYTNMHQPLDPANYPPYYPERPRLGLRTQLALDLIDTNKKLSLEDVLKLKHSYRMLLADRVRDDLVRAVQASHPVPDVKAAIEMIARWDKTVAPESRGGVLFELWWRRYIAGTRPDTMYAEPWSAAAPTSTPRGIRFPERAVTAFSWAVSETVRRYGRADVAWGDVHRVRIGDVDLPVGGCNGDIGCFRVLWYKDDPDGKREAVGGDGWILAVEFGDEPRAYSVLAYGESQRPDSPFHTDQAAMFARGELKPVAWSDQEIEAQTIRRYHPGVTR